MFPLYTPWKHQKTVSFLVFSGGKKWEHWPEMGQEQPLAYSYGQR